MPVFIRLSNCLGFAAPSTARRGHSAKSGRRGRSLGSGGGVVERPCGLGVGGLRFGLISCPERPSTTAKSGDLPAFSPTRCFGRTFVFAAGLLNNLRHFTRINQPSLDMLLIKLVEGFRVIGAIGHSAEAPSAGNVFLYYQGRAFCADSQHSPKRATSGRFGPEAAPDPGGWCGFRPTRY